MKKSLLSCLVVAICLAGQAAFSQTADSTALGLAGDNLDLYAVLDLFQKSKTIEGFEKSLNLQETGINNLDLDLDNKVDFIKVVTKKTGDSYSFILQVDVSKTETQDVAVILLDKDKNKKVTLQIVGDEVLYGKDYVIEPKSTGTPAVTANPAYVGADPVKADVPATPPVIIETVPVVQYVYSPVYVPYVPPYYYGFPPPYFAAFTIMAVGIYRHNNYYHHGGYHGGHYGGGNTVIINNRNNYNNYNNNKMRSNTVADNKARGGYNSGNNASTRQRNANSSPRPSNRQATASPSTRQPNRQSTGASPSQRSSTNFSSPSRGGGRSMGGGGSRGGGGGGRRR